MELDLLTVLLLTGAAFIAGVIDAIAGGGGLITIPALLFAGANPVTALGTNKLQAVFGAGTSAASYARAGLVKPNELGTEVVLAAFASAAGAAIASVLPSEWLEVMIPIALIGIALFFAFRSSVDDRDTTPKLEPIIFGVTLVPLIGFYDGIFGPGTGSFFMIALVGLCGYGVLKATAQTKVLNFASNFGGLIVFALTGAIEWRIGLLMAVGQTLGAVTGAKLAVANGARLIKPLLVVTCVVLAVRLLLR